MKTDDQPGARIRGKLLRIKSVFARTLPLLESRDVRGKWTGPEDAVLYKHVHPGSPAWIELNRVARHVVDLAVADHQPVGAPRNPMGIPLILERAV